MNNFSSKIYIVDEPYSCKQPRLAVPLLQAKDGHSDLGTISLINFIDVWQ